MSNKPPRLICIVVLSLTCLGALCFGLERIAEGDKYDDAKPILLKWDDHIKVFIEHMNKAEKPKAVAEALDEFAEGMKGLIPMINEIMAKYPELKDERTHPEELKSLLQQLEKDFQEMLKAYAKVIKNIEDPAVKEADEKYKQVMSALR